MRHLNDLRWPADGGGCRRAVLALGAVDRLAEATDGPGEVAIEQETETRDQQDDRGADEQVLLQLPRGLAESILLWEGGDHPNVVIRDGELAVQPLDAIGVAANLAARRDTASKLCALDVGAELERRRPLRCDDQASRGVNFDNRHVLWRARRHVGRRVTSREDAHHQALPGSGNMDAVGLCRFARQRVDGRLLVQGLCRRHRVLEPLPERDGAGGDLLAAQGAHL